MGAAHRHCEKYSWGEGNMGLNRGIGGDQDKRSRQENLGAPELRRTVRDQRHHRDTGNEAENHGACKQSDCMVLRQICAQHRGVGVGRGQEDMAKSEKPDRIDQSRQRRQQDRQLHQCALGPANFQ
ncbi:hypothetical protein SAMN02927924_04078 [Sphingobium faniae]|nr:hypothetical protein SAMN02927924_04078 [Sphingobium faniae]